MAASIYWLKQRLSEAPANNNWLTPGERVCLEKMRFPKRRAEWRLGRWTAKCALASYLQRVKSDLRSAHAVNLEAPDAQIRLYETTNQIEIRAAADGAPEVFINNECLPITLSISHRDDLGFCAINTCNLAVGCDIEKAESRRDNFVEDYFTAEEKTQIARAPEKDHHWFATLIWSAKESTLKALRQGLRLDTRSVVVDLDKKSESEFWNTLIVRQTETSRTFHGWWRIDGKFVQTIVAEPFMEQPIALQI